jgi:hypothetical protein
MRHALLILTLLLSLLLPFAFFCSVSLVYKQLGWIKPMYGSFGIQTAYTIRGPGGTYGFYEVAFAEDNKRQYGVGSDMMVAGRLFHLPLRLRGVGAAYALIAAVPWLVLWLVSGSFGHEQKT